ncbi:MAG: hypothetical protein ACU84J_06225 [Gammaproteobacteria bacterium]
MNIKLSIGLLGMISAFSVNATTVLYQDFNQLVDGSEHVIAGTVADVKSSRHGKNDPEVYTVVTLENAYSIKAHGKVQLRKKVKLRYKGGMLDIVDNDKNVIGREVTMAHGTPQFVAGEKVVVFVNRNGVANMPFHGWGQGVFRVGDYDELLDHDGNPVVGMQGADLVVRTDEGVTVGGRPVNDTTPPELKERQPELLDSDGGSDVLVTQESLQDEDGSKLGSVKAMSAADFESMIEEHKADMAFKGLQTRESDDDSSLFNLPEVASDRKVHESVDDAEHPGQGDEHRNSAADNTDAEEPVLPLKVPEFAGNRAEQ